MLTLSRTVLDMAGSSEQVRPDEDFFVALRARIARGPESLDLPQADLSWAAALGLTARQFAPVMALLLVIIIGLTVFFPGRSADPGPVPAKERVVFNDIYEYPHPTQDDVFESLVAVEEKQNGL
jgi:hypothetical protein